jgi:carbamoyl-phosphate synthase large subunit
MSDNFNVLISSAGRRVALVNIFRRALADMERRGRVMAADMSSLSSAFHSADHSFLVPSCTHPEFIPSILKNCRQHAIDLVIPTIDPELPIYAEHRESFSDIGTTIAVSTPEVVAITCDKVTTHQWLVERGFPTVKQFSCGEGDVRSNGWPFPLLVKPRRGSASIGVAVVEDRLQLEIATRAGDYVAQTIAAGNEHTIDVLTDRAGRCVCAVPRRRLETRSGESSKGITVRSEELISLAERICESLPGAYGPLTIQVFVDDSTGEINVVEINPRFGGGFPLSWEAGARYPQWMIEEILGLPSTATDSEWQSDLVMLRWDEGVFVRADKVGM